MDIRQLHYFLVLCEEMNYTRAAQRLFLSRQALRQSISALEAELCGPLFLSAHHKLSLTERGVSLQRHDYYRTRKQNPLKKMQSVIAIACKLIRIFYTILTKGVDYDGQKMLSDIIRPETIMAA